MEEETTPLPEAVTISVERLIRFCYFAHMTLELAQERDTREEDAGPLPLHLTRCGTLMTVTCSFLYSLFDKRKDSTNLRRIWTGFNHPFGQRIEAIVERLNPFMQELGWVRSRYDFHGSLSMTHQQTGFGIFEGERGRDLFRIVHDMKQLAVDMTIWFMAHNPNLVTYIPAFRTELLGRAEDTP
jgi:hypothetical protein